MTLLLETVLRLLALGGMGAGVIGGLLILYLVFKKGGWKGFLMFSFTPFGAMNFTREHWVEFKPVLVVFYGGILLTVIAILLLYLISAVTTPAYTVP